MFNKLNLAEMMKKAQQLQEQMQKTQKENEKIEVVGSSGADLVQTTINGKYEVIKVEIDQSLIGDDKAMLEDLVAASFSAALVKLRSKVQNSKSDLLSGLPDGFKPPF